MSLPDFFLRVTFKKPPKFFGPGEFKQLPNAFIIDSWEVRTTAQHSGFGNFKKLSSVCSIDS